MNVTKIRMQSGCDHSTQLIEIDEIYIDGIGYHRKEAVYDYLKLHPGSILLGLEPFLPVLPVRNEDGDKYVRTVTSNLTDMLLHLPKEASSTEKKKASSTEIEQEANTEIG